MTEQTDPRFKQTYRLRLKDSLAPCFLYAEESILFLRNVGFLFYNPAEAVKGVGRSKDQTVLVTFSECLFSQRVLDLDRSKFAELGLGGYRIIDSELAVHLRRQRPELPKGLESLNHYLVVFSDSYCEFLAEHCRFELFDCARNDLWLLDGENGVDKIVNQL